MIKQLKLKNYILIDELCANFDNGLNIITGETGAGKSIILNAIDLVFSARVSKEVIKNGCDKAIIEISLENTKHNLSQLFEENGIDNWGDEIVISKEITQNSVRSRINGTLVNQELLKSLRTLFVDIHSQHQTYTFLQPQYHINLLDSYAKDNYGDNLEIYKTKYKNYEELVKRLEQAKLISNETEAEIDFLKFQINEIEEANITSPTEDEELTKELDVLQNAEKLKELTSGAYWAINGDDGSIMEALTKLKSDISKASDLDNKLEEIQSNFIDAIENLRDISSSLRNYSQNLDNDTQRLDEIQERLYLLDKLKRKYGDSLEKVMENYENFSQKLSRIENLTGDIDTLEKDILTTKKELYSIAQAISEGRKKYSQILSGLIQEKLAALEMPKARFEIRITPKEDLSSNGIDDVEFMISTNVSEDLKPLAKVASGGEISRVMLAIKSIFATNDDIDTVIFDEIDTGISGRATQSVAEEMLSLGSTHQIIAITHQAIIASKANKHFYVRKSQQDETKVEVYVLTGQNRIKALAELAGGTINEQSIEFAKSLLQ